MKKYLLAFFILGSTSAMAQDIGTGEEPKGFQKNKLFTGGSISLSFGSGQFIGGVNPVLGYSLLRWIDAGVVLNYTYASTKNYQAFNDKLRQSVYGGGAFTRIYPVKFIFVQAQAEHNFINVKYENSTGLTEKYDESANSFLVGGGYTTGRDPGSGKPYAFISILFDIGGDSNSPYVDNTGSAQPLYRAGINIPLFQGKKNR